MPGVKLVIAVEGFSQASKGLEKLAAVVQRPFIPSQQSAVYLAGETIRAFEEGGRPEKWAPLSLMSLFIRQRRKSAPTNSTKPMNDHGRLKGSIFPVVEDEGEMFGAATNVEYASLMQRGGVSTPSEIEIGGFTRRLPETSARSLTGLATWAKAIRGKQLAAGSVRVKPYILRLKGGARVPARPFFPEGMSQVQSWGYLTRIREIFAVYFKQAEWIK